MDFLIGIVSSVVGKIAECTVTPVVHQLGYFFNYERNIRNLRSQIQQLIQEKEKLQHLVIEATNRGDEIEQDVRNRLTNADELVKKSEIFFKEEGQANTRYSGYGTFPNMVLRRRLSRKAEKMAEAAGSEFREVQNILQNKVISYRDTLPSSAKSHETFESRISTLKKVMDALRDPNVNRIGVYGMAGVGKTTLAKAVEQQALEERLFNVVVMVPISQTPNFLEIQQIIADKLGFDLREKAVPTRAERLLDQLMKQDKKILVILDDVWKQLALRDIGLISSGDDRKGFKMLLTSRFLNVCRQMDVDKSFEVGILVEGEALNLFQRANGDTCRSQDVQDLVADIVMECAGLPLAITTIASALKGKHRSAWEDVLRELRRSSPTDIDGMEGNVYSSIKMSYDFLGSDEARSLLVFCSLHKEDAEIQIHQLLRYGLGFGLFEGITTLEEARNKVFNLVDHLKSSSLLLDGRSPDFVKLHDVVRDVLISIAAKSKQMYLIKDAVKQEEYASKFGDSVAISLLNSNFDQLPKRSVCARLKLLFMFGSGISDQILDKVVFEETTELRVLLLTSIQLGRLQSCFRVLENLQTLCLNFCQLEDIASIGELKHLKVLDLAGSGFEEVPREIGQLTSLRLLDLSSCRDLRTIKPNVISSLTNLEELNLRWSFSSWEVLDKVDGERSNASLVELSNLSQLSALYIRVEDASVVPKDKWLSDKLKRYQIVIGVDMYWMSDEISRGLAVRLEHSWQLDEYKIQTLVKTSEELLLVGLVGLGDVVPGLDKDSFPHLKRLSFRENDQIRYIVNLRDYMNNTSAFPFPKLESLYLQDLRNLEGIWQWHGNKNEAIGGVELEGKIEFPQLRQLHLSVLPKLKQFCPAPDDQFTKRTISAANIADTNSIPLFNHKVEFPSLTTIQILYLSSLKKIFPSSILLTRQLPNLTSFEIYNCDMVEEIFDEEMDTASSSSSSSSNMQSNGNIIGNVKTSQLSKLTLSNLPKLKHVWNNEDPQLGITHQSFVFQNLKEIDVHYCPNLETLFPPSLPKCLVQLESLTIRDCESLQNIVAKDKEVEQGTKTETMPKFVFPKLKYLILESLPALVSFYSGLHISEWPSLQSLHVFNCRKVAVLTMDVLSFNNNAFQQPLFLMQKVSFPNLEEFTLEGYDGLVDEISHARLERLKELNLVDIPSLIALPPWEDKYQNLEALHVWGCVNLKSPVMSSSKVCLQNLTSLAVSECHRMVNLLTNWETAESLGRVLRRMSISNCQSMTQIIAGDTESEAEAKAGEFVFSKLETLVLHNLPSLTCFYSGKLVMKFPNLERVIVSECLHMQSFCLNGAAITLKLDKIFRDIYDNSYLLVEWQYLDYLFQILENASGFEGVAWKDDMNTTLQHLWRTARDPQVSTNDPEDDSELSSEKTSIEESEEDSKDSEKDSEKNFDEDYKEQLDSENESEEDSNNIIEEDSEKSSEKDSTEIDSKTDFEEDSKGTSEEDSEESSCEENAEKDIQNDPEKDSNDDFGKRSKKDTSDDEEDDDSNFEQNSEEDS